VLVEGFTYEQLNDKVKKSKTMKVTSWSIRADVVRKLDRNEQELQTPPRGQRPSSDEAPF
jgi:hypothetical protein